MPNISDYFGSQAQVVDKLAHVTATISATNPCLVIPLAGLSSTGFTRVDSTIHPDAWLAALLKKAAAYTKSDADETSMIEIAEPQFLLNTRSLNTVLTWDYRLSVNQIYRTPGQSLEFDPDNIRPDYSPL